MSSNTEKETGPAISPGGEKGGGVFVGEKEPPRVVSEDAEGVARAHVLETRLDVTEDDLLEAKELAASMTLEETRAIMVNVYAIHKSDPNFPHTTILKVQDFLENDDIMENPDKHAELIYEMKLEAALITNNSPYAEVRAVVDNHDDPSMPAGTIRAWTLGIIFSVVLAGINQMFSIRLPSIYIDSNVAQLLAYPLGRAWEMWVPRKTFTLPWIGTCHLNPGRFNKKEHMLIAIMANTAKSLPYTQYIVWTQVLPHMFNQQYARSIGYQLLIALSTNFIGYGLAGLLRPFLVYPSYCVWPRSLVTIALNSALHDETNTGVLGPFGKIFNISRFRFFLYAFAAMFVYFWFPNYLFETLTFFSWATWISPNNHDLEILMGFRNGLGLFNPWPTFDWNVMYFDGLDPLMVPAFSTFNRTAGMFLLGFVIMAVYYTNTWNTAYLPINSNRVWDHFGQLYNVSRAVNERGMFDLEKYMDYSAAYMGAGNTLVYGAFFAIYAAVVTHVIIFHRHELVLGLKNAWRTIRRKRRDDSGTYKDVHNRLMSAYPEVKERWYFLILAIAMACGFAGIGAWPTYTTLGVVPYGMALCIIFVVPIGITYAITGVEVTLNVLAEFIGGLWVEGNALAMNFFKSYGYVTCAHALSFANDLKVAHYLKIPPRHTFAAQVVATLISTFVCVGVLQIQMNLPDVCTQDAPMRFTCPGPNTFFTASVLWGTIGPVKVFGYHGQYGWLLMGFPLGILTVMLFWGLKTLMPKNRAVRQIQPVLLWYGGLNWAPYSFSYAWPAVPIAWCSWIYIRNRFLGLWSKYNFVLSAAFSAGIAISGIIMLFTVQWFQVEVNWWGNEQPALGCEGSACTLKSLDEGDRFYPWWSDPIPAP